MKGIFFIFACFHFLFAESCYFIPPKGWEIAQLINPSPHIQIGFIGKGTGEFLPKINLAIEDEVDVSLKKYVKIVKELQMAEPNSTWRDLGVFPMKCGQGRLAEISKETPFGPIKILQAFFVKKEKAYILTAAFSKKDYLSMQPKVLQSFRTLDFTNDLMSCLKNEEKQKEILDLFSSKMEKEEMWKNLQNAVGKIDELGQYWQYLVLQEGHKKIYRE